MSNIHFLKVINNKLFVLMILSVKMRFKKRKLGAFEKDYEEHFGLRSEDPYYH